MAQTIPDIEQAPRPKDRTIKAEETIQPFQSEARTKEYFKKVEAEKVIVLSFRGLQLRRIAELQDNLLTLSIAAARGTLVSDTDKTLIDKALKDYGKFCYHF